MYIGLHVKYRLLLSDLHSIFSKNTQISNLMKIPLMGAELCHTDGQTHMTNLTVTFRKFPNAPKKNNPLTKLTASVTTYQ